MKFTSDLHTHTLFSFDADFGALPVQMAEAAHQKGLEAIALTDHLEVNSEAEGLYKPFEFERRHEQCQLAISEYKGKINVLCGIELGQPTQYPALAEKYLNAYRFDFVLGSLHNVRDMADFALIDYKNYTKDDYLSLWRAYLSELYELTEFDGIDSLSHLTYPLRYFKASGFELDVRHFEKEIEKILNSIISKGICLEINSSGFRQGLGCPLPDEYIISLYKSLGGRLITIGSDSHTTKDIASGFDKLDGYVTDELVQFIPNRS